MGLVKARIERDCELINARDDSCRVMAEIEAITDYDSWGPAPEFIERK